MIEASNSGFLHVNKFEQRERGSWLRAYHARCSKGLEFPSIYVLTLTSNPAGDERKIMTDFDWSFNPKVPRGACFDLHTLKFVADSDNVLLIGKPGTGKATSPKPSPTTPHCRG